MELERSDAGFPIVQETDRNGKRKVVRSEAEVDFPPAGKGDEGRGSQPLPFSAP